MINLKITGAVVLLAIAPVLVNSSADARSGSGHGGGAAASHGGGSRGGATAFRSGTGSGVAARNFAAPAVTGGAMASVGPAWSGRRHWDGRRWIGPGVGFAAGLATGAAIGGPYGYDFPYYDSYGASGDSYAYYDEQTDGSDSVAYCQQRYRSYDPASGTYLGYDGLRHPCP